MMTELELCETLGIVHDPDKNRLVGVGDIKIIVETLCSALHESSQQKHHYGSVNTDLWLDFLPWHSLN